MARRRFKRFGLNDAAKADVCDSLRVARKAITEVTRSYYFEQAEYQAACAADAALVKLGETLGRPDDSMWRDGAKLATPPEDKRD